MMKLIYSDIQFYNQIAKYAIIGGRTALKNEYGKPVE